MLTVLVSTVCNSQVILLKKNMSSFLQISYSHFSAKILEYMPYLMTKVLTIRLLTTSLVLNNWTQTADPGVTSSNPSSATLI